MDDQEALEILATEQFDNNEPKHHTAMVMAFHALKKQVPRNPIKMEANGFYVCPHCQQPVATTYCPDCGQKLNWKQEVE